jgi:hypothetical protein
VTSPPTAQAQRLFDGKIDYGNTRNIYPVIPELEAVMHSPRVAGALASLLGPGYVMDRRKHMHNSSSQVRPAPPGPRGAQLLAVSADRTIPTKFSTMVVHTGASCQGEQRFHKDCQRGKSSYGWWSHSEFQTPLRIFCMRMESHE